MLVSFLLQLLTNLTDDLLKSDNECIKLALTLKVIIKRSEKRSLNKRLMCK